MFEVVFLGTSASAPSIHRGLTATAILAGPNRYLVDCGEGTQRQILRSGIGFKKLNRILLTHGHLDHILGIGGLVSTFSRWEENLDFLEILGGKPAVERVKALIFEVVLRNEKPPIPIHLIEVKLGQLYDAKDHTVTAFSVTHRGSGNFGYLFEEKSRRPFLVEKAEALAVPVGPERAQLVRGESITLENGTVITPDMVLGEEVKGTKLVHVGDTARTDNLREIVRDADALVIEGTFLETETEEARRFGHLTVKQAATLALEMNVKTLLINHVSRRYYEREIIKEARSIFPNVHVARDLDHFIIKRGQLTKKKVD
jgi:ribonuclease Z